MKENTYSISGLSEWIFCDPFWKSPLSLEIPLSGGTNTIVHSDTFLWSSDVSSADVMTIWGMTWSVGDEVHCDEGVRAALPETRLNKIIR